MKKILAFAGSNSKKSINKQLVEYTTSLLEDVNIKLLDLNDYSLPIYGIDIESENGIPDNANLFLGEIKNADGIIISLAEHNGNFSAVFKNLFDWMSRIEQKLWNNKPMLIMATSPGGRGGKTVLELAKASFPRFNAEIVSDFSLANFYDNFKEGKVSEENLKNQLVNAVALFKNAV